jgi:hypothetical protein
VSQFDLFGVKSLKRTAMTVTMSAEISECMTYRWTLTRSWGDGPKLCWVMLNPSTADHHKEDHTSRRVLHFTEAWGYDGFTVVNLYPFRSSEVPKCREWAKGDVKTILQYNVAHVTKHTSAADRAVAAWGNKAWDADWIESLVAAILGEGDRELYCLGTTISGAPIHPGARGTSRVPDDQQPLLWRQISAGR